MADHVSWWRRMLRLSVSVLVALLILEALAVVVFPSRRQPAMEVVRRFTRNVLDPPIRKPAGRGGRHRTAVHHIGRRSGKEYTTPVRAERVGQSFFIPLPHGTDVDWCRNVLASGGCVIEDGGVRYDTLGPVIGPARDVAALLEPRPRRAYRRFGAESYLQLHIAPPQEPAVGPG